MEGVWLEELVGVSYYVSKHSSHFLYLVFKRILTHNHHQLDKICIRISIVLFKIFRSFYLQFLDKFFICNFDTNLTIMVTSVWQLVGTSTNCILRITQKNFWVIWKFFTYNFARPLICFIYFINQPLNILLFHLFKSLG